MKKLTLDAAELHVVSFEPVGPHFDMLDPMGEFLSGLACSQPYYSCRIPCPVT